MNRISAINNMTDELTKNGLHKFNNNHNLLISSPMPSICSSNHTGYPLVEILCSSLIWGFLKSEISNADRASTKDNKSIVKGIII